MTESNASSPCCGSAKEALEPCVVWDNRKTTTARLAILIPVHDDVRIFALLDALKTMVDDRVHLYILNDFQPESFLHELPEPLQGVLFHSARCWTIAAKTQYLLDHATCEWRVIVESDALPHKDWLSEIFHIMENGDPACVHQGGEIFRKVRTLNNILTHRHLRAPRHPGEVQAANDIAWFLACDEAGIPVVAHDVEAILFHDRRPLEGDMRFIQYARDNARLAIRYPKAAPLKRRVLAEGYYLVRGLVSLPVLLACYAAGRMQLFYESLWKGRRVK